MKNGYVLFLIFCLTLVPIAASIRHSAPSGIDKACVYDCRDRGFSHSYCEQRCNLDPDVHAANGLTSDPKCMHNCSAAAQPETYCRKACTY